MLQEEHHVSKLHFSWPQVSCVSGFPIRGIRSVFVRYRDHAGEASSLVFTPQFRAFDSVNLLSLLSHSSKNIFIA